MRAVLLDEEEGQEEILDNTSAEQESFLEDVSEESPMETLVNQGDPEDDIPEKYKGKSLKDIVRMHQEAEKLLGRHSSEVGELRKVVDDYIRSQETTKSANVAPMEQQEEEIDFFLDPDKAINRAIEQHPSVKQAQLYTEQARKASALATIKNKHPDMEQIIQDASFAEWIKGSKIRTQLFLMADQGYDPDAADELFSLWKERQQVVTNTANVEKAARKESLKAASTGNTTASQETLSKKKYRRADIIKLMRTDPDRYEALQPEIMRAYAEGRVV